MPVKEKSVLYKALEDIKDGSRAIAQFDVRMDQSIEEDLHILKRHLGVSSIHSEPSGLRGLIYHLLHELANLINNDAARQEATALVIYRAHELAKKASRPHEEITNGPDTLLLVLPFSVDLPNKGLLETGELKRLIESAHFIRCLERDEANRIYAKFTAPDLKVADQRLVQIVLAKKIKPNLKKFMLTDVIISNHIQAELEQIENLSPTADLPDFV